MTAQLPIEGVTQDAWTTFRRIVTTMSQPGDLVSANTLRPWLDAADIPEASRGGYFSAACKVGLIERHLDEWGYERATRSSLETTKGSRVLVYRRCAA